MKGKFLTLVGTAFGLALSCNVAAAQSTKFPELMQAQREKQSKPSTVESAAPPQKLAPDVMEILCIKFTLSKRCKCEHNGWKW